MIYRGECNPHVYSCKGTNTEELELLLREVISELKEIKEYLKEIEWDVDQIRTYGV